MTNEFAGDLELVFKVRIQSRKENDFTEVEQRAAMKIDYKWVAVNWRLIQPMKQIIPHLQIPNSSALGHYMNTYLTQLSEEQTF